MLSRSAICSSRKILVLLLLACFSYAAQAGSGWDGTWELNVAKSTFDPGPPLKRQTRTYKIDGEMTTLTIESVEANGEASHSASTYRMDGKEHPVSGSRTVDAVATTRVDDRTVRGTLKRAGKAAGSFTRTLAHDGKSMTVTVQGTDPDGKPYKNTLVLDRK